MAGRPEKFSGLREFLQQKAREFRNSGQIDLPISFTEIEAKGVPLPPSAYKYDAWWLNNNYTRPWSKAGFRPKAVDRVRKTVKFQYSGGFSKQAENRQKFERLTKLEKPVAPLPAALERIRKKEIDQIRKELSMSPGATLPPGVADVPRSYVSIENGMPKTVHCRHPIYGALKGHIRLVAGTDLTEPADPEWGKRVWGEGDKT